MQLESEAVYYPWASGRYEVVPAMRPLGEDFGNGIQDKRTFQIDRQFARYRDNKLRCNQEDRGKYVLSDGLSAGVTDVASDWIADRLIEEYPERFRCEGGALKCDLTRETVVLKRGLETLGQLMNQVQEDLAIIVNRPDGDRVAYLNLCSPSHWAGSDKIGRSFFEAHVPIPGFERINRASRGLVDAMVNRGPWVRFGWGVESDDQLNHHPVAPTGKDPLVWNGRDFRAGRFWVRTERQVIWGLPEVNASLFFVRIGYVSDEVVLADERLKHSLRSALESMSPEARVYKGLETYGRELMGLLA